MPKEQVEAMKRFEVINYLAKQNNAQTYLEIGFYKGENFRNVNIQRKISVDPDPITKATFGLTSDDFFAGNQDKFDLIFIDGLHLEEQVMRDVSNSLLSITDNGIIVLHDCLPFDEITGAEKINPPRWHGTVWRAWARLRQQYCQTFYMAVLDDGDGCGIIIPSKKPVYTDCLNRLPETVREYRMRFDMVIRQTKEVLP